MAVCKTNSTFGLIGFAKDTIVTLPCEYQAMPQIDSNQILLQYEEDVVSYTFSKEKIGLKNSEYLSFLTQKSCQPIAFINLKNGRTISTPSMVSRWTIGH